MAGEYALLARVNPDVGTIFIQYGYQLETRVFNVTQGTGFQNGICAPSVSPSQPPQRDAGLTRLSVLPKSSTGWP